MKRADLSRLPPNGCLRCHVEWLPLVPGKYWVDLKLIDQQGSIGLVRNAATFLVTDAGESGFFEFANRQVDGSIIVPHRWELEAVLSDVSVEGSLQ